MEGLRVIADDLTGACDVGAALLPWPEPVLVEVCPSSGPPPSGLRVRNTRSRTLAPDRAAAAVRGALAEGDAPILLKKIDTGLRGPLGAEIDAAIDAAGASEAFVLTAIPDAGRTTVDGVQLADGVPVDRTAFARDPENPVRDARVAAVIESTSRHRAGVVRLADVRDARVADAIAHVRGHGAEIVVFDAETDDDLDRAVAAVLTRARPLVFVGSTGLGRALRRAQGGASTRTAPTATLRQGVLVVVGSVHPATRAQVRHATRGEAVRLEALSAGTMERLDALAAALAAGAVVVLDTADDRMAGRDTLATLARVAAQTITRTVPGALALVGGETAEIVLRTLGVGWLELDDVPAPLAVRSRVATGPLAGMRVVTKGGSTGPVERLAELIDGVRA
jgi:uncharacterized protein YgbK (DUF1537 family)